MWPPAWAVDCSQLRSDIKTFVEVTRALSELFSKKADYTSNNPQFNDLTSLLNTHTSVTSHAIFAEEVIFSDSIELTLIKKLKKKALTLRLMSSHHDDLTLRSASSHHDNMAVNNAGFLDTQCEKLQVMFVNYSWTVTARPPGPPGSLSPPEDSENGASNHGSRWNSSDLRFFDLHHNSKSISTESAIDHAGKDTYFQDIHLLTEWAKQMYTLKDPNVIHSNLWLSLRDVALKW